MGEFNTLEGVHQLPTPMVSDKGVPVDLFLRSHVTPRIKSEYETWLEAGARHSAWDLRPGGPAPKELQLSQEEFDASVENANEIILAKKLKWGGKVCRESLQDIHGIVQMIVLLSRSADRLMKKEQNLTPEQVLSWIKQDEPKGGACWQMVCGAVKQILSDSPNFMSPPARGTTED